MKNKPLIPINASIFRWFRIGALAILLAPFPNLRAAPGDISTVAGTGTAGYTGDGGLATASGLTDPFGVALDAAGNLYIADFNSNRIRKVDAATGIITTVAGTGTAGYNGDGIAAATAQLDDPVGVALDAAGNLFIADRGNHRIRRVAAATGLISTVAGTGTAAYNGDGIAATTAQLNDPNGVALDFAGNLFIADKDNNRIRKVADATGVITTVAGDGTAGFSGDSGLATAAKLLNPKRVAFDAAGNLFIIDNHRIRKVAAATGVINTIAGTATAGYNLDNQPAATAQLNFPNGIALDAAGNLFIADQNNHRVRKIDAATAIITTVAGTGTDGYNGDGIAATTAQLDAPRDVALDAGGNLYIAESGNDRVRRVEQAGVPVTLQPDNHIGTKRGRQRGDDRYNLSGSGQVARIVSRGGRRVKLFFTAENDANVGNATGADVLKVRATRKDRNFNIKYLQLKPVRRNVTAAIIKRGYAGGALAPGAKAEFMAQIKPKKGVSKSKTLKITSTSQADPTKGDTVKGKVKAKK